jgi:phage recombination protein Bet
VDVPAEHETRGNPGEREGGAMSDDTALAVIERQPMELTRATMFTIEQEGMIREMYAPTATPLEFQVLIATARARRLNPILQQIHFVKRRQKLKEQDESGRWIERWEEKWSCQVSIDGLRAKAEETGLYDGQDEPEFEWDEAPSIAHPWLARVRVYKKGVTRPFVGVARWNEFVQTYGQGATPTRMWSQMPSHMLAKCAEALALRKAFPEQLGGLFTSEEMGQADNPDLKTRPILNAPRQKPRPTPNPQAIELAEKAAKATDASTCEAVLAEAPPEWTGVIRVAYQRLVALAPDVVGVRLVVERVKAMVLDDRIKAKVFDAAEKRIAVIEDAGRGGGDAPASGVDHDVSQAEAS